MLEGDLDKEMRELVEEEIADCENKIERFNDCLLYTSQQCNGSGNMRRRH